MARKAKLTQVPENIMQQPLVGYNLNGSTLAELLDGEPTLLVFLRHFGCIFCKEMVGDLRAVAEANPAYPRVLFVNHGQLDFAEPFFANVWPQARCIVDTDRSLYVTFGVERMGALEALNPGLIACGMRAASKGYMQTSSKGDPRQMPGLFYMQGGKVLWQHDFKHAGDHPDWKALPQRLPAAQAANPTLKATTTRQPAPALEPALN